MSYRNYSTAVSHIVDPNGFGDFTTIAAALTAAVSGQTIFIRPGTYTENLTLKVGVNLSSFGSDASFNGTGKVIISGTCTLTTAGTVSISGIQLQTNSAALLAVTGSAASIVNINNCYLNCSNNTGITFSSSNASAAININYCMGNLGTTGIGLFTHSSLGLLSINYSSILNLGASTTASTVSAGTLNAFYSDFALPITTSSTGALGLLNSLIDTSSQNITCLTVNGSGSSTISGSEFSSGSASSISIGATLIASNNSVSSTNTNAITGAGTLINGFITFPSTSSKINTTTISGRNSSLGGISFDGGTNTMSFYTVGTFTPTLVGQSTAGTTTYTVQQGYYTRIGNMVTVWGEIVVTAATGTGNMLLGALPFTIKNQVNYIPFGTVNISGAAAVTWPAGTTHLIIQGLLNTITANINAGGSAIAGGSVQMANSTYSVVYTLSYQI